jgi:hypothetical protein
MRNLITILLLAALCLCAYGVKNPDGPRELIGAVATHIGHFLRRLP